MPRASEQHLDELVASVRASAKYQAVSEDLIRAVGRRELAARGSLKEALKATKNKLHQVAGAYLDARPDYDGWLELLAAQRGQGAGFRAACAQIMRHHASTRERLPIVEAFYRELFAALPPPRSVLDVACGLNPLARPWMPLPDGTAYYACDLYADMVAFLNGFFGLAGVPGQAAQCDLLAGAPRVSADVALALKVLPPLEQLGKDAGRDLLRALDAPRIVVSFPTHSLGGRGKGMAASYDARFRALAAAEGWPIERFEFAGELVFIVAK
ncbi:16S rRNA methyltransferase [Kouleothrix sp.]|uniref:16S rRNA methyltransferase n=1 Tax=Kouleothrix sp. TaxID=2779161 RepID=UPI00391A76B1